MAADKTSVDDAIATAMRSALLFEVIRAELAVVQDIAFAKRLNQSLRQWVMIGWSAQYGREIIGPDAHEYANKTDFQFWPRDIADEFHRNDMVALSKGYVRVDEPYVSRLNSEPMRFVGSKYVFNAGGEVILKSFGLGIPDAKRSL